MFQFSHRVTNYIFRLLIYCKIPRSEKSESCWETSSAHTWQSSIVSKPTRIPNPHLLLSHIHTNITWCLSHHWMFVADSTEDLCSFRQWGNVGLPLCILCLASIFPTDFPTPSPFPLICCCSSSHEISLHRLSQSLFLLTLLVHLPHAMLTMCRACICEKQHQAVGGVCCPLTQKIYFPSCSLPWHLKFFTFLTTGTRANKMFIGTKYDLKLAHKWSLLFPPFGSPALCGNWRKPLQRVVCWEPPARTLPVISGIYL